MSVAEIIEPAVMRRVGRGSASPTDSATNRVSDSFLLRVAFGWLAFGILLRGTRFFLKFPLWEDEAFLCVNLIDRDYLGLTRPLDYHQVAPACFLWVQKSVVDLCGFSEWSLRLFPLVCSVAALLVFYRVVWQMTSDALAVAVAVGVFSVAYSGTRYAAEAKQYASDLFLSATLLALWSQWQTQGRKSVWLWLLAVVTPVAVLVAYPSVFVAGAISAALLVHCWRERTRTVIVPWLAMNGLLLVALIGVLALAQGQASSEQQFMADFWKDSFPDLTNPLQWPQWFWHAHAGEFFAYPVGGRHGGSILTAITVLAGAVWMIRHRPMEQRFVWLLPFGLQMLAAAMQKYPYGGHVKFSQAIAPAICLLMGLGTSSLMSRIANPVARARWSQAVLIGLGLIGVASLARDIANPTKTQADARARAFAMWFWPNAQHSGEVACVKADLHQDFSPGTWTELSWSAQYLCNLQIYSPRHHARRPLDWNRVSATTLLWCVLYRDGDQPFDEERFDGWMAEMQKTYRLDSRERYPLVRHDKRERQVIRVDELEVFCWLRK
jgi:4-amino-4-deoxy-L-arabinose transferase-like glycosyltransferase